MPVFRCTRPDRSSTRTHVDHGGFQHNSSRVTPHHKRQSWFRIDPEQDRAPGLTITSMRSHCQITRKILVAQQRKFVQKPRPPCIFTATRRTYQMGQDCRKIFCLFCHDPLVARSDALCFHNLRLFDVAESLRSCEKYLPVDGLMGSTFSDRGSVHINGMRAGRCVRVLVHAWW